MHRLFLLALLLSLTPSVFAQTYAIDKGSYFLGGTASFSSQGTTIDFGNFEPDTDRFLEMSYTVGFGYFIVPGLALGADSQYIRLSQDGDSETRTSVGPSLSYFFGKPTSKAFPFVSASVGFSSISVDIGEGGSGSTNGYRYGFAGGLSYMIARNVALTGSLFYRSESFNEDEVSVTDDAFGFQGGVSAFIF